jgi:hypothetical protein
LNTVGHDGWVAVSGGFFFVFFYLACSTVDNGKKADLTLNNLKAMLAPFYVKPVVETASKK